MTIGGPLPDDEQDQASTSSQDTASGSTEQQEADDLTPQPAVAVPVGEATRAEDLVSTHPDSDPQIVVPSDRELLTSHVAGDPHAFGELVRRHRRMMWAVALRILRNEHDAQDAVQNALERAFQSAEDYRGQGTVGAWIYRVVSNSALDIATKAGPIVSPWERPDLEPRSPDPATELRLSLDATLMTLPEQLRTSFFLVQLRGFAYQEAAELMGVPRNTVATWVFRARSRIVSQLGDRIPLLKPRDDREK